MANRTFTWVLFTLALIMTLATGAALVYFYPKQASQERPVRLEQSQEEPVATEQQAVEPEPVVTDSEPETVTPEVQEQQQVADSQEPQPEAEPVRMVFPDADVYYWLQTPAGSDQAGLEEKKRQLATFEIASRLQSDSEGSFLQIGPYLSIEAAEFSKERIEQFSFIEQVDVTIEINR